MPQECHDIEQLDGKDCIAWSGEAPWHNLGTQVPRDASPEQILVAAGLNWTVSVRPAYAEVDGDLIEIPGTAALIRDTDRRVLSTVGAERTWNACQNQDAFEFFDDFVRAGDMTMETAGSLANGSLIWCLAKVNQSFELFGGDHVENHILMTNPHRYGKSIDFRVTPVRVVCRNTMNYAMRNSDTLVRMSHRKRFDGDKVKEAMGIAAEVLESYRQKAEFIGTKRYTSESVAEYFNKVFPITSKIDESKMSRNASLALGALHMQPGANFAEGTFWQAFNAVTYLTDHVVGRSESTRLEKAWYGSNRTLKIQALDLAVEMANAA